MREASPRVLRVSDQSARRVTWSLGPRSRRRGRRRPALSGAQSGQLQASRPCDGWVLSVWPRGSASRSLERPRERQWYRPCLLFEMKVAPWLFGRYLVDRLSEWMSAGKVTARLRGCDLHGSLTVPVTKPSPSVECGSSPEDLSSNPGSVLQQRGTVSSSVNWGQGRDQISVTGWV